uniref:LAM_G_DOMAIN domain-containing protein n=1 Tax=Macrostomum lignano TaxID=282301 RepID=A0A1I8FGW6_9PLAT
MPVPGGPNQGLPCQPMQPTQRWPSQLEAMKRRRRELRRAARGRRGANPAQACGTSTAAGRARDGHGRGYRCGGLAARRQSRLRKHRCRLGPTRSDYNARRLERQRAKEPQLGVQTWQVETIYRFLEAVRPSGARAAALGAPTGRLEELATGEKARACRTGRRESIGASGGQRARLPTRRWNWLRASRGKSGTMCGPICSTLIPYTLSRSLNEISSLRQFYHRQWRRGSRAERVKRMTDMMNEALELERIKNDSQRLKRLLQPSAKKAFGGFGGPAGGPPGGFGRCYGAVGAPHLFGNPTHLLAAAADPRSCRDVTAVASQAPQPDRQAVEKRARRSSGAGDGDRLSVTSASEAGGGGAGTSGGNSGGGCCFVGCGPVGQKETPPTSPAPEEPVYKDVKFYQPVVQPPPELRQDPLAPTFYYDPSQGFILYMDFITGLDVHVNAVAAHNELGMLAIRSLASRAVHPLVRTEDIRGEAVDSGVTHALLAHKQGRARASPLPGMGTVLELQCRETLQPAPVLQGVDRLGLFDSERRLVSGRFKAARCGFCPSSRGRGAGQLNSVPQWGKRHPAHETAQAQDAFIPQPSNTNLYSFASAHGRQAGDPRSLLLTQAAPGTTGVGHGSGLTEAAAAIAGGSRPARHSPPDTDDLTQAERILGFQVDRVKHAEPGTAKLRLSAYLCQRRPGGVGLTIRPSPPPPRLSARTSRAPTNVVSGASRKAVFYDVDFSVDMPQETVIRSKLEQGGGGGGGGEDFDPDNPLVVTPSDGRPCPTTNVVAWAAHAAVVPRVNRTSLHGRYADSRYDLRMVRVNKGTHELPLRAVIDPQRVAFEHGWVPVGYRPYARASVRLHIFHPYQRARSLTPSDDSDESLGGGPSIKVNLPALVPRLPGQEDNPPPLSWIPLERRRPPLRPVFTASDGFDLYLDGCRFLPDTVTITKIRSADCSLGGNQAIGNEISCMASLDSDIYNPEFDHRQENSQSPTLAAVGDPAHEAVHHRQGSRRSWCWWVSDRAQNEGCHQLRIIAKDLSGKELRFTEDLMSA